MNRLDDDDLTEYELQRFRNIIERNSELVRYLNLHETEQEPIEINSNDSNQGENTSELGYHRPDNQGVNTRDISNQRPRRCKKSPNPPTRPRSQRLLEREERQRLERRGDTMFPSLTPSVAGRVPVSRGKSPIRSIPSTSPRRRAPLPSTSSAMNENDALNQAFLSIRANEMGSNSHADHRYNSYQVDRRRDLPTAQEQNIVLIGKKNLIIVFLIMFVAFLEWHQCEECCKKTASKLILNAVIITLIVNLIHIIIKR